SCFRFPKVPALSRRCPLWGSCGVATKRLTCFFFGPFITDDTLNGFRSFDHVAGDIVGSFIKRPLTH
ncbi:MAG: hypothetical protein V7661_15270, partial [Sulfitobacter sp.]